MKGTPSDNIVSFYFSLDEPRRWAIREALRIEENGHLADDLLHIEAYYRGEHNFKQYAAELGVDASYRKDPVPEQAYSHLVYFDPVKNEVKSFSRQERKAKAV